MSGIKQLGGRERLIRRVRERKGRRCDMNRRSRNVFDWTGKCALYLLPVARPGRVKNIASRGNVANQSGGEYDDGDGERLVHMIRDLLN